VEGIPGLGLGTTPVLPDKRRGAVGTDSVGTHPAGTVSAGTVAAGTDAAARAAAGQADSGSPGVFTRFALDHATLRAGRALAVLQAGCTTAGRNLDLSALDAAGHDVHVSYVDADTMATRAAVAGQPGLGSAALGELRLLPLRPRTFDIVHCSLLLHRISHAEVVLSRLAASVRPGGLLMLRIADPASAAGFLDRTLPRFARGLAWRAGHPGEPGPHPAIYEPVASAAGIEAFVSRHGLAVAHRTRASSVSWLRHGRARPAARIVTWTSRGRLSSEHDELCYVIRKPEDRFARILH
jgi:SAM-dependent methyltransferase